ncbi:MAG TPA: NUDIX hydrolase [Thermoanaerobaculia bacterium]|nr:NUDIX hydrolase [Thermoanaerobaculia bacterium]
MRRLDLLAQLQRYRPSDALEARHQEAIVELIESSDGAFDRGHFVPGHITASCYIVHGGALLLHHHRRLNRWLQMGGHVERDEHPAAAALREGSEESGLRDLALAADGIFDLDVHVIPAAKGEPEHRHFDVRYVARTEMPDAVVVDPAESSELAWVPLAAAESMMNEAASSRVIQKIRSRL